MVNETRGLTAGTEIDEARVQHAQTSAKSLPQTKHADRRKFYF